MYDEQYERLTADCKPGKPNAIFISINDPVFVIPNDQHWIYIILHIVSAQYSVWDLVNSF